MKENNIQQRFLNAWEKRWMQMDELNIPTIRMRRQAAEQGSVETAHRCLKGRRCSDGFDSLQEKGRLELSLEELVLEAPFGSLFSDEEVNEAIRRLLEAGYAFR